MNGYKIVLLKAIFMLYKLPESERVCSGICTFVGNSYLLNKIVAKISRPLRKLMTINLAAETSTTVWRNRIVDVLLRH